MPTLHAVIVGIDHYDGEVTNLCNAYSDAHNFLDYLKSHLNPGFNLNPRFLPNREATKRAVVNAFGHFRGASGADVCLFYFAGHGSKLTDPPDELMHLAVNKKQLETIVCQDSRMPGGADLVDQEIAHLIGTTVNNIRFSGNGHFVAIMDCCHSGHGTRLEQEGETLDCRAIGERYTQKIQDFHGYSGGRNYPTKGPHVQLAACGQGQKAYDGKYTPLLLRHLEANGANATYAQIQQAVSNKVSGDTGSKQVPEIYSNPSNWGNLPFLGGAVR